MADQIAPTGNPRTSPRHGIAFAHVPTRKGSMYGGSYRVYPHQEYGPILDSVLEMASDIADSNCVPVEQAIRTVCQDESWVVLPRHQRVIAAMPQGTPS